VQTNTVSTQYGEVVGAVYDTAIAYYQVPYAEPPVGNLRFMPPQPFSGPFSNGTLQYVPSALVLI
jgi:carboxylesterase type B